MSFKTKIAIGIVVSIVIVLIVLFVQSRWASSAPAIGETIIEREEETIFHENQGKWDFIWKHSPLIWFSKYEKFFPSPVDHHLINTKPVLRNRAWWTDTIEPMRSANDLQPFFYGNKPNDYYTPPTYALIFPAVGEPKSVLDDPLSGRVVVVYNIFYPYNLGKRVWALGFKRIGNHVGDFERITITYDKGVPVKISSGVHSWSNELEWGDPELEMNGGHPVCFSASGSHGVYFTPGTEVYNKALVLIDVRDKGRAMATWRNIVPIFPDEWDKKGKIKDIPQWDGFNWITDIFRWGNPEEQCVPKVDECALNDGPTGFIHKEAIIKLIDHYNSL